jgi:predicted transposase/invertase (TIGR01784 family)
MNAEKAVRRVNRDYERYARKMAIIKNSMDRASEIYDARMEGQAEGLAIGIAEGRAEGKAEGITENNLDIARKMKNAGRPFNEIMDFTGLTAETIESL